MRLRPVRRPDPLHAAVADPGRFSHHPAAPLGCLTRWASEGHRHDPFYRRRCQWRLAAGPGGIAQKAVHTRLHKALLPSPDGGFGFASAALDLHRADPVGTQQHDP
jgi:hypothetical protein